MVSMDPAVWSAALLTIFATSYVFKDNPAFKFAEHTVIGAAAGYSVAYNLDRFRSIGLEPMLFEAKYLYIIPIILALTVYFRYNRKYYWIARYGVAFMAGQGIGIAVRARIRSDFIIQLKGTTAALTTFDGIIIFILVVTGLLHFVFTIRRVEKEPFPSLIKIGRYGILMALGASFGNTVMTRLSMYQGRMLFLIRDWLQLIAAA